MSEMMNDFSDSVFKLKSELCDKLKFLQLRKKIH